MRTGYQLSQVLKSLKTPNNNDRLARAAYLVNAVAYAVPFGGKQSFDEVLAFAQPKFVQVLNEVNENVAIDVRLAKALFERTLRVRFNLAFDGTDPAIVKAAMTSLTAEDYSNADQLAMAEWLTSRQEFMRDQTSMAGALAEFFTEE